MSPKLAVIIPTYNSGKHIEQAIKSVLMQTYKNFELIIVDNGSTDETIAIIQKHESKDTRIQYFQREHMGLADARNFALKQVKASHYIANLCANDYINPLTYETQIEYLEKNDTIDGVSVNYNHVVNILLIKANPLTAHPSLLLPNLSRIRHLYPCILFRKRVFMELKEYRPFLHCGEDTDLFYRCIEKFKVEVLPDHFYYSRHLKQNKIYTFCMISIAQLSSYARRYLKKDPIEGVEEITPKHFYLFLKDPRLWPKIFLIFLNLIKKPRPYR